MGGPTGPDCCLPETLVHYPLGGIKFGFSQAQNVNAMILGDGCNVIKFVACSAVGDAIDVGEVNSGGIGGFVQWEKIPNGIFIGDGVQRVLIRPTLC